MGCEYPLSVFICTTNASAGTIFADLGGTAVSSFSIFAGKLMIIGYNECPRLASLASTLVLPVFPGASARQVLAEASLTDLSRDSAEGIPNYVEQKQSPHDFRHRGFVLALPIFPGRLQPSIVGRSELNFRVRDGNGWTLALISTNLSAQQCSVMPTHVQLLAP